MIVARRYCNKCGKVILLTHYPYNYSADYKNDIKRELDILEEKHQTHLCLECSYDFATCKGEPVFGDCVGEDNVVDCQNQVKEVK